MIVQSTNFELGLEKKNCTCHLAISSKLKSFLMYIKWMFFQPKQKLIFFCRYQFPCHCFVENNRKPVEEEFSAIGSSMTEWKVVIS